MQKFFQSTLGAVACLSMSAGLYASDIYITTLDDSGAGSLREAMTNAIEGDLLYFDSLSGTITLQSSLPDITAAYTIFGPTGSTVVIDGGSQYQIFNVAGGGVPTINDLTLINGSNAADGGCINIASGWWAVLNNITVSHCNGLCTYPVNIGTYGSLQATNLQFASGSNSSGKGIYMDNASMDYTIDGSITVLCMVDGVSGNLLKWGQGTLAIGANSVPTDITLVAYEGNLDFNGETLQPALAIYDGTFSGNSSVYYLVNYGILKPENSLGAGLGSITTSGDYTQLSGGELQIGIDPTGENDYLQIGGNVLLGGSLLVNAGAGTYTTGTVFTFLTTDGRISGTFSSVDCSDPSLDISINYDTQSIEIEIL